MIESGTLVVGETQFLPTLFQRVGDGERFAGLFGSDRNGRLLLTAALAAPGRLDALETELPAGTLTFPPLSAVIPSASWYEREIADLFGVHPEGAPRQHPLVLPVAEHTPRPRPGTQGHPRAIHPDDQELPSHVAGHGLFKMPYGPVRSGVFEAVEYLIETPGEEILHVWVRVFYKHRGLEKRFEGLSVDDGILLAERVEGIASVAHAIAFSEAVERICGQPAPDGAQLVRALHAELERIANHLESAIRLTEAAGLAVANARMALYKERVLRLVGDLCGSRFGRGVVVPGGVANAPQLAADDLLQRLASLQREVASDAGAVMETEGFLDRLRGTGQLSPDTARRHGILGPVGRGSGAATDVRIARPYGAYPTLGPEAERLDEHGDTLGRLRVRWQEIDDAFRMARGAAEAMPAGLGLLRRRLDLRDGREFGWAEAPQGELLYLVELRDGRIVRCKPRSASFHNLHAFPLVFRGDILTDFAFIEGSFGLSIAGVAG